MNNSQAIKRLIDNSVDDTEAIKYVQTYGTLVKDIMGEITRYQLYQLADKFIEIEMTLGEYDSVSVWNTKPYFSDSI
jgi:hypothetical protein